MNLLLKRKIRHQCHYRGTRELDLILRRFVNTLDGLADDSVFNWDVLEQFLEEPEPILTDWLIHKHDTIPQPYQPIAAYIISLS
jgi:succinate dehydrogenase flavin-adding protein (antitoxin of CptAB toxin-antitoxin module)